jgi:hypothetical protein
VAGSKAPNDIFFASLVWEDRGDIALKRKLETITKKIMKGRRLQRDGGLKAYENTPVYAPLSELVEKCHSSGLFIVPVGQLEDWVKDLMTDVDESRKPERALIAATRIKEAKTKQGDIWDFMRGVLSYLELRIKHPN